MSMKKRMSMVLIMLMLTLTMAGCGDKAKEESTTKATEESSSVSTDKQDEAESASGESTESEFDFSQVFDNIEVDGKKVPFPFCLNDLGEGYELKYIVDMQDGTCGARLYHGNDELAIVYLLESDVNAVSEASLINGLTMDSIYEQKIKINGIDCDSSPQNIEKKFENLPKKVNEEYGNINYIASNSDNDVVWFAIEENKISTIRVRKRGIN